MKNQSTQTIRFKAKLSEGQTITLPKSASDKIPKDTTMIEGVINNFPFRAPLKNNLLKISKSIQKAAGAEEDDTVEVEITRLGEEPEIRMPIDLKKALKDNLGAQKKWEETTPMARRDWILSITTVKQQETRRRRIEKTCDMLASGKGRVCCFPGLNWITRDHVKPEETWLTLPKSKK